MKIVRKEGEAAILWFQQVEQVTHITQSQLESYLWGAATLLRGLIDAGDYKQFIFPLLFFKRLCDVYDEEYQRALDESGGDVDYAAFAENHRFQIPAGAHWRDVRAVTTNVGQALQNAMRAIEQANQGQLYGIFGDAQWTNKERLSDATLRDLVEHFSSLTLSVANVPEDELGNAYEYLIKKFADDSGHTAAEFYTNRTVVQLMTRLLDPQEGESIYDPTAGSGGMLLSAAMQLKRQGKEWRTLRLYGQERNLITSAIARMNLFLHGFEDFRVERGDTLADSEVPGGGQPAPLRPGAGEPAVFDQAVEPQSVGDRPLRPQLPGHAAAGPRRLRLLPAHPGQPAARDRPLRDPLSARRAVPRRGARDAGEAGGPGHARSGDRAGAEPVLQLADGGVRGGVPDAQAAGAVGQGALHQRGERGDARAGAELPGGRSHREDRPAPTPILRRRRASPTWRRWTRSARTART